MLRHYITLALRTLWRNKFHTFINVTGLSIGISACLVIYLIVSFELSFNKKFTDYDRLYRIHSNFSGTFAGLNRGVPTGVAPYVKDNFKGVESVTLFSIFSSKVAVPGDKELKKMDRQEAVIITGPDYFDVFTDYRWIAGSPDVLSKPHQVVLTEKQAELYFGNASPQSIIGKEVIYQDSLTVHVAGIVHDLPFQTDLTFTDFISLATAESGWLKSSLPLQDWENISSGTQVFLKTQQGTSHNDLLKQLPLLTEKYAEKSTWATNNFNVQPLSDLHYNSDPGIFDFNDSPAHMPTLLTLIGVAAMLLLIGAINFVNLETAQAIRRAREVGVRKVLGSTRMRLIVQFVCEGLLLTLIAVILAMPLTQFGLYYFSEFVPQGVTMNVFNLTPFLLFIIVCIGLLASAYPAFIMSSFVPAVALKNVSAIGGGQSRPAFLRKVLIVFQFSFAQVLIISTLMVGWQIRYLLNKDLGFNKDAVIYFETPWWEQKDKTALLKNELDGVAEVSDITLSNAPPSYNGWSSSTVEYNSGRYKQSITAFRKFGDTHYLNFYGIDLLAGVNLQPSDTVREFVINETMMRQMEIESPQEAVGKVLHYGKVDYPVVGVVRDFHIQSLHKKVEPVIMSNETKNFTCINLRLSTAHRDGDHLRESLARIEAIWKKHYPEAPFEYKFLDDTIRNFYATEQRTAKLSRTATGLAIFISCLGLFGLASFTTTQRTKEIGIRKVFGASIAQIVNLLSRDFIVLVMVAFALAAPVAWFSIARWLEGFEYRTEPGLWMYLVTALLTAAIAFATIGYQAIRAAKKNPSESLRSE